jgi:hypothetical protein
MAAMSPLHGLIAPAVAAVAAAAAAAAAVAAGAADLCQRRAAAAAAVADADAVGTDSPPRARPRHHRRTDPADDACRGNNYPSDPGVLAACASAAEAARAPAGAARSTGARCACAPRPEECRNGPFPPGAAPPPPGRQTAPRPSCGGNAAPRRRWPAGRGRSWPAALPAPGARRCRTASEPGRSTSQIRGQRARASRRDRPVTSRVAHAGG